MPRNDTPPADVAPVVFTDAELADNPAVREYLAREAARNAAKAPRLVDHPAVVAYRAREGREPVTRENYPFAQVELSGDYDEKALRLTPPPLASSNADEQSRTDPLQGFKMFPGPVLR